MKRSYSSLNSVSSLKRLKPNDDSTKSLQSPTQKALTFFLDQSKYYFMNNLRIPPIIFKHQLYSFKPDNRTLIDCELQAKFNNNEIRFFHSDLGIMLMYTSDYLLLINQKLTGNPRLKQRFIEDLLPKSIRLSIDRNILEKEFSFNLNDIHLFIESGLLLPKHTGQYWFSIPNLSPFIICLQKGRRTLELLLSRRTYREIPMNEFRNRDLKKQCVLGFDYHIYDLIGANLAHIIDAPTGPIVKMGPEKV